MEMPNGKVGDDNAITIYSGAPGISHLAVDSSGNIYWTNNLEGTVMEMPAGKSGSANAITLYSEGGNPYGIAVDSGGNVYWTDMTANSGSVMEMPHDLTGNYNALVLYSNGPITNGAPSSNPAGMAIDQNSNVYWTDYGTGSVLEMPHGLTGDSNAIVIYSGQGSENPDGIAVNSGNVYWADVNGGKIREYAP
jgi:sugar lactone lactonase YvrE